MRLSPILSRFLPAATLLAWTSLWAQQTAVSEETAAEPDRSQEIAQMEAFLDGVMTAHLEAHHVAGATLAVVLDGRLVLAKGYGYADFEQKKKVDPEKTLFRIGSVSKLFTWTAVMQQFERRKVDLEADVNTYLADFQIPATYPEPITLTHLMTHTPGFEDLVIELFARSPEKLIPLGQLLKDQLPKRVRPPGKFASYSNHGTGMAGYIVEQTSGKSWDEYVETEILQPLGMEYTTFRQPLPEPLEEHMSKGYRWKDGRFKIGEFEYIPLAPAGSASASAADMARFMIAHLQNGRYGEARILEEATAQKMHSRIFAHSPQVNGMMYGFYEMNRSGETIFGHGGDTIFFHTQLALWPERNAGLFVSYNSVDGPAARGELMKTFIERFFSPPEKTAPQPPEDFKDRAARFEGSYRANRHSHTTVAKVAVLASALQVAADREEGLLVTRGGGDPGRWVQVEPLIFEEVDGPGKIVFREDDQGRVTHLFIDSVPVIAFEKESTWESRKFHLGVLAATLLVFLLAFLGWPIGAWRKRRPLEPQKKAPGARLAVFLAWCASALFLGFMVLLAVGLSDPTEIVFGIPRLMRQALMLPLAGAALLALTLLFTALAWRKKYWNLAGRLRYTIVAVAGIAFLWWLNYWNLLGFRF